MSADGDRSRRLSSSSRSSASSSSAASSSGGLLTQPVEPLVERVELRLELIRRAPVLDQPIEPRFDLLEPGLDRFAGVGPFLALREGLLHGRQAIAKGLERRLFRRDVLESLLDGGQPVGEFVPGRSVGLQLGQSRPEFGDGGRPVLGPLGGRLDGLQAGRERVDGVREGLEVVEPRFESGDRLGVRLLLGDSVETLLERREPVVNGRDRGGLLPQGVELLADAFDGLLHARDVGLARVEVVEPLFEPVDVGLGLVGRPLAGRHVGDAFLERIQAVVDRFELRSVGRHTLEPVPDVREGLVELGQPVVVFVDPLQALLDRLEPVPDVGQRVVECPEPLAVLLDPLQAVLDRFEPVPLCGHVLGQGLDLLRERVGAGDPVGEPVHSVGHGRQLFDLALQRLLFGSERVELRPDGLGVGLVGRHRLDPVVERREFGLVVVEGRQLVGEPREAIIDLLGLGPDGGDGGRCLFVDVRNPGLEILDCLDPWSEVGERPVEVVDSLLERPVNRIEAGLP